MEEVRERQRGHIDLYLPERHFTSVIDDDGSEKLVFFFKEKEVISESKSKEDSIFMSFSAKVEPELKATFCQMSMESSDDDRGGE
jgi:hypothetical protein